MQNLLRDGEVLFAVPKAHFGGPQDEKIFYFQCPVAKFGDDGHAHIGGPLCHFPVSGA